NARSWAPVWGGAPGPLARHGRRALAVHPSRRVPPADDRRADAVAGQLPDAGAARVLVGADDGVDQVRLAAGERGADRLGKISRSINRDSVDAGRAGHGGEIRIVGCAGLRLLKVRRAPTHGPRRQPRSSTRLEA